MALYIISAGTDRPTSETQVKIGYAVDAARRVAELQAGHWDRLFFIRTMDGDRFTEGAFHARFASNRIDRDWFWFDPDMMTYASDVSAGQSRPNAAEVLDKYLRTNNVSTVALAAEIGTHQTNVSMWRTGKRVMPAERVVQISAITGIPRHELRPDLWEQAP